MKLVSFNIRCDYEQDGIHNYSFRREKIFRKLKKEEPDVICFQEVLPHVADDLIQQLPGYYLLGCGREADLGGETTAIAYRKDAYRLIAMQTFWLSETPCVPGSRYEEQSICPRTCTEALLFEKESGRVVRILNTHLDHEGERARLLGIKQIVAHMKNSSLFPLAQTFLAGDFNAFPEDEEVRYLIQEEGFNDLSEGMEGTFHDYGQLAKAEKIDYVMAYPKAVCGHRALWKEEEEGSYLSDHYPLFVEITTK